LRSLERAVTYQGKIYLPVALSNTVTSLFNDNQESAHFGALKSAELLSRDELASIGVRDTKVRCERQVVLMSTPTVSHTVCTQHDCFTDFSSIWGTYIVFLYRLARVNSIGIHQHLRNC
jgi:hypothetical protein